MALETQIAEIIIQVMDQLGGSPHQVAMTAMKHPTVEDWISLETTKVAASGAGELIIPGLQPFTIPAGITFLLRKMAHISWGIGALKGCYVVETAEYSDLRNIMAIWANDFYFNSQYLEHRAISMDVFTYIFTDEGSRKLETAYEYAEAHEFDNPSIDTMYVLRTLRDEFPFNEQAQEMVTAIAGADVVAEILKSLEQHEHGGQNPIIEKPLSRRISARLALRMAEKLGIRVPAKVLLGFLPIAGAIVNGFFNVRTLNGIAESAEKYYDYAFTISDLENIPNIKPVEHAQTAE